MKSQSELTLFAAASLAKIFLLQEKEPESKGKSQVYSMSLFESCGLLDPSTSSSKIPLQLLGAVSELSSKKLPKAGMMRNGQLYQRESVALLICATAGGPFVKDKIPTPTVRGNYNRKGLSKTSGDGLATWVKKSLETHIEEAAKTGRRRNGAVEIVKRVAAGIYATPMTSDATKHYTSETLVSRMKREHPDLPEQITAMEMGEELRAREKIPTPRESDVKRLCGKGYPDTLPVYIANNPKGPTTGLETIARRESEGKLPTPKAHDAKEMGPQAELNRLEPMLWLRARVAPQPRRKGLETIAYREERGILPTPRVNDACGRQSESEENRLEPCLWYHVLHSPTPGAAAIRRRTEEGTFITPTKWDATHASQGNVLGQLRRDNPGLAIQAAATSPAGGKLNPLWVEWLMGFPIGWTDLKD